MRFLYRLAYLVGAAWIAAYLWNSRPIHHPPGVLVPMQPAQMDVPAQALPDVAGFHLTGVARYSLRARVLGTKRYWDGPNAKLVPIDVALGWGAMSDESILSALHLSQSNRFFFYEWDSAPPIPAEAIVTQASNNHIIAANADVAHAVKSLRTGQIVQMEGWLVNVTGPGGFRWKTSLRRDDTGNGACELYYVESIAAVDDVEPAFASPTVAAHTNTAF
jgi:hypothetical protein